MRSRDLTSDIRAKSGNGGASGSRIALRSIRATFALARRGRPGGKFMSQRAEAWPELPYAAWKDTYATLHLWTQIVGKVRLARTP